MTSDDPVDVTAISIIITMRNSPVRPSNLCATTGGTRPERK